MTKGNILFDLDGTLTDYDYTNRYAIKCVYERMNRVLTDEEYARFKSFEANYWKQFEASDQEQDSHGLSRIDYARSHIYQLLFDDDYIPLNLAYELMNIYIDNLGVENYVYDYVPEIVEELSEYYNLYIASNGPQGATERKLRNTDLLKYFKDIISSEQAGYSKPSPHYFEYVFNKLGIRPYNTIFIGDSITSDIIGASNQGMKTIWYNPNGLINRYDVQPNYEINSMEQLKKIL